MKKKYLKPDLEVIALETCVTTLVGFSKTTEGNPPNNKVDAKEHNAEAVLSGMTFWKMMIQMRICICSEKTT